MTHFPFLLNKPVIFPGGPSASTALLIRNFLLIRDVIPALILTTRRRKEEKNVFAQV